MARTILTIFLLCSVAFLTACGTKGALYIPEQRYPQKTQQDATSEIETPTEQTTKE